MIDGIPEKTTVLAAGLLVSRMKQDTRCSFKRFYFARPPLVAVSLFLKILTNHRRPLPPFYAVGLMWFLALFRQIALLLNHGWAIWLSQPDDGFV